MHRDPTLEYASLSLPRTSARSLAEGRLAARLSRECERAAARRAHRDIERLLAASQASTAEANRELDRLEAELRRRVDAAARAARMANGSALSRLMFG